MALRQAEFGFRLGMAVGDFIDKRGVKGFEKSGPGAHCFPIPVQERVFATVLEKVIVTAALDDLSFFDDENMIGAADRGEAVRDDEGRAIDHQVSSSAS